MTSPLNFRRVGEGHLGRINRRDGTFGLEEGRTSPGRQAALCREGSLPLEGLKQASGDRITGLLDKRRNFVAYLPNISWETPITASRLLAGKSATTQIALEGCRISTRKRCAQRILARSLGMNSASILRQSAVTSFYRPRHCAQNDRLCSQSL